MCIRDIVEPNVFILVQCDQDKRDQIIAILKEHYAINYGVLLD